MASQYTQLPQFEAITSLPVPVAQGGTGVSTRILQDSNSLTSINYASRILVRSTGTTAYNWETNVANDASSVASADFINRQLKKPTTGIRAVDWASGYLWDAYYTNTNSIDWGQRQLLRSNGSQAIVWDQSQCTDSANSQSIDWQQRYLAYSTGIHSVAWDSGTLLDTGGNDSVDWASRWLVNDLGSIVVDWENCNLYDENGTSALSFSSGSRVIWDEDGNQAMTFSTGNRSLYAAGLKATINYGAAILYDISVNTSLDWYSRVAYCNDGVTAAIQYGSTSGIYITSGLQNYKNVASAGWGLSQTIGSVALAAQTATLGNTNIVSLPADGLYEAKVYLNTTTLGSAATVSTQFKWTDTNSAVQTVNPIAIASILLNSTAYGTGSSGGSVVFAGKNATQVQYNTTVTGSVGTGKYDLRVIITRIQ